MEQYREGRMSKYAIENEPTYCNILHGKCPEATDGEKTYCHFYCQLYSVYSDYEARSSELDMEESE